MEAERGWKTPEAQTTGLLAVSCIAWLGGCVASPQAWNVKSADEKRVFTADDRTRTLPETQAITPRVARKELAAAHRSKSRAPQPDSGQSREVPGRRELQWPDGRRSRIPHEPPRSVVTRT